MAEAHRQDAVYEPPHSVINAAQRIGIASAPTNSKGQAPATVGSWLKPLDRTPSMGHMKALPALPAQRHHTLPSSHPSRKKQAPATVDSWLKPLDRTLVTSSMPTPAPPLPPLPCRRGAGAGADPNPTYLPP